MNRFILIVATIVLIFSACQKEDETNPTPAPEKTLVNNVNTNLMLQLVNEVRKTGCTCGSTVMVAAPAITWSNLLSKVSFDHSVDMFSNQYFSHTGQNGSTPGTRLKAAGYNWRTYGENIANGYKTEQQVMAGWLRSEGHCKNIMNPAFKEMGAGRQGDYWTQLFGAR